MLLIKSNIYSDGRWYDNLLIDKGKIVSVGVNSADVKIPKKTIKGYIYPSFFDSHTHILWYGLNLIRCDLNGVKSRDEIYLRISKYISENPDKNFVIAEGFDETAFSKKGFPEKSDLDSLFCGIPVIVRRIDGHIAVINEDAYRLLKPHITDNYDKKSGIIKEGIILALNRILKPPFEEKKRAILKAQEKLFSLGITGISDMATFDSLDVYRCNELKLDIRFYYPHMNEPNLKEWSDTSNVKLKGLKIFSDGSIGGYTASVTKQYKGRKGFGKMEITEKNLKNIVKSADRKGYQLAVHAIGDNAVETVINCLKVGRNNRIEHFELASKSQIKDVKKHNIILSMQPNFIGNWSMKGQMYEKRLSNEYYKFNNVINYINNQGIVLGLGSDCMPPSPVYGIKSLTEAQFKEQRTDAMTAFRLYTEGSSAVAGEDKKIGKIEKGFNADFIVTDEKIEDICRRSISILRTYKNGKEVFKKE